MGTCWYCLNDVGVTSKCVFKATLDESVMLIRVDVNMVFIICGRNVVSC